MRATRPVAVLAVALAALSIPAARASARDIVGTRAGVTEVPGQGPDTVTITITRTERGHAEVRSDPLDVAVTLARAACSAKGTR